MSNDNLRERQLRVEAGDAPASPFGEEAETGRNGRSYYLEPTPQNCARPLIENRFEVRACGCRNWFCADCCRSKGLAIKHRLIPILESFKSIQMWTFTVDPKLFRSPREAFEHVKRRRAVSKTIAQLNSFGYLHSKRFFCVTEWQKDTEMAHYHALVETGFVPFKDACDVWNSFRPGGMQNVSDGVRPGFGSVCFSMPKFKSRTHAANYACKYLIKYPECGFPDWVLDLQTAPRRYSISHGFWGASANPQPRHDATCFCKKCRGDIEPRTKKKRNKTTTTLRERVDSCGHNAALFHRRDEILADGEVRTKRKFYRRLKKPFIDHVLRLNVVPEDMKFLDVPASEVGDVLVFDTPRKGTDHDDESYRDDWCSFMPRHLHAG